MRTKNEIKALLWKCCEKTESNEGVTMTLVFDKVADLVIELSNQPSERKGVKAPEEYLNQAFDDFEGGITGAALLALNNQGADYEMELIEFARFATMGISEKSAVEYIAKFRSERAGDKPKDQ